jgi:trimethylamine--corrinoid protein Co-methyltransferase
LRPYQGEFRSAFWRSELFDYKPYETWEEEGARDTQAMATERVARLLGDYEAPAIDPATREALEDYVARRKAAEPDAFV